MAKKELTVRESLEGGMGKLDLTKLNHNPLTNSITSKSSTQEIIDEDLAITGNILQCLHQAWGWVDSLHQVTHMANTTMSVLAKRRILANKKLGSKEAVSDMELDITD